MRKSHLSATLNEVPLTSKNARATRGEITISILERAIKASPENKRSAYLWIQLLKAGEEIWDKDKLNDKWEEALRSSESADIAIEWFDWRIKSNTSGIQDIKKDASRASGLVQSGEQGELTRLRLFWRTTVFLKESGEW